jgi:2-oxoglutarate ferredoxin oxidoreductase subunit gamma
VVLVGTILAEAAGIFGAKHVLNVQDYGGAMRGGAVKSEVVIAEEANDIDFPGVLDADILLAMTQEAANKYVKAVKANGVILLDATNITQTPATIAKTYKIPFTSLAREKLGTPLGANLIALGFMCQLTGVVDKEKLLLALRKRMPKGTAETSERALQIGIDLAENTGR